MTRKDFQEEVKSSANVAVQRANKFLGQLDLSIHINWEYSDWRNNGLDNAIGVYERDSVIENGDISIGFNVNSLYRWFVSETEENPWSDEYTILDEAIQTNVYHEMGHGIVQFLEDLIEYWDEEEELPFYDENQQFIDTVLDNEEDSVEEFAWAMYDNRLENSSLYKVIQLYLKWNNTQNISESALYNVISSLLENAKIGGFNYANRGDEFYTRQSDLVNELSHYDLNGKVKNDKYITQRKRMEESFHNKMFTKFLNRLNEILERK